MRIIRLAANVSPQLALLLVLLLAAFLRFWQLSTLPPGLYHDEAYNGLDALSLVQGKQFPQFYEGWELYTQDAHGDNPPVPTRFPLFFEGNYGREPLHVYLMALSIWIFGPSPFATRAVPALFGVLAVWTTYFAAAELLRGFKAAGKQGSSVKWVPLVAAYFLAILVPAIHFSRFGIRAMLFVPIEMLAVAFFWQGYNHNQASSLSRRGSGLTFLAAGFFLGLGIYTYAAARLFPLLFVVFVLFWAWQDWSGLRQHFLHIGMMAGAALLTALPLLLFFWQYPYFFVFRIAYVANKGRGTVEDQPLLTWLLNIGRVIRGLYWQGETHLRHNLPGRPYLDPVQALLFSLGLIHTARQKLNPRTVFLVLWLVVMLLPTILSGDAPHFGRMTGAAGVIAIFVALGFVRLVNFTHQILAGTRSQLTFQFAVCILLLAGSLFFTVRDYFGRYASHPQLATDFYIPDWELGKFAAAQPAGTAVYLTPTQEEMATIFFALANPDGMRSFSGTGHLVPAGFPGKAVVYLVRLSMPQTLAHLQGFFPMGVIGKTLETAVPFLVPADAPRTAGLLPHGGGWAGEITLAGYNAHLLGNQLYVTLAWQPTFDLVEDYTAFVHLLAADGTLVSQQDRQPEGYPTSVWQSGEIIVDTFFVDLPADLSPGGYTLQTGFYTLPTVKLLDAPVVLERITLD